MRKSRHELASSTTHLAEESINFPGTSIYVYESDNLVEEKDSSRTVVARYFHKG